MVSYKAAFSLSYRFPKDEGRRQMWIQAVKRKDFKPTAHTRICSKHFEENCFDKEKTGGNWLHSDAVPTKFDFPEHLQAKRAKLRKPPTKRDSLDEISCAETSHNSPAVQASEVKAGTSKCFRYIGDFKEDDLAVPGIASKMASVAKKQLKKKARKLSNLQRSAHRMRKKILNLESLISDLQKNNLISESMGNLLKWDPKITTLPGLYVFSVIYLKIAGLFMGQDFCDIHGLRVFNVFLCLPNFILIYRLQRQISTLGRWCDGRKCLADECKWRDLATALNMSLFPVLYYFAFFYYTEQLSTFTVLLTYSLSLTEYTKESAIMGIISIFVRQTNVMWIGFILLIKLFSLLQRDMVAVGKYVNVLKDEEFFQMVTALIYHPLYSWWKRRQAFITLISNYVVKMRHYLIVCVIFMIFVVINGGIVVGDKLAHVPVLHLSQMLYFILFASSFCMPYFIILGASFKSWLRQHYIIAAIFLVLCAVVVHYYTFVHPYLLADNRHYVFYIWKLLYERNPMIKYFLIPIYLYGGYCITYFLDTHSLAYKLSYLICVFLILVPQKLLEFRYFILPFLIFRLNVYPKYRWQLWLEFFMYAIINLSTFYLFLTREIRWDDIAEVQRLMW